MMPNLRTRLGKKCQICGTTHDYRHSGECEVCTNKAWVFTCTNHPNLILHHRTCPVCEVEVEYNEKEQRWRSGIRSYNIQRKNLRWVFVLGLLIGAIIFIQLFDSGYLQSGIVQSIRLKISSLTVQLESANRELDTIKKKLKESESNVENLKLIKSKSTSSYAKNLSDKRSSIESAEKQRARLEAQKRELTKTNLNLQNQLDELDAQIKRKSKMLIGNKPKGKPFNSLSNDLDNVEESTSIKSVRSLSKAPDISIIDAARKGDIVAVRKHLSLGTYVDTKDNDKFTPLHWAVYRSYKVIVELLIDKGADVNAQDIFNKTPLDYADGDLVNQLRGHGGKTREEMKDKQKKNNLDTTLPDSLLSRIKPIEMVWINSGVFKMGSPPEEDGRDPDEGPQTTVTITKDFAIGKYEVTNKLYNEIMGDNYANEGSPLLPVSKVSWNDAVNFCEKLTEKHRINSLIPKKYEYRLPTEAEWEFACRAGSDTSYSHGDHFMGVLEYGWSSLNSESATHKVGMKKPNSWGLYDMHGNVEEWVLDNYHDSYVRFDSRYGSASAVDPLYLDNSNYRIVRGGAFDSSPLYCRSAERERYVSSLKYRKIGFRIVLSQNIIKENSIAFEEEQVVPAKKYREKSTEKKRILNLESVDSEPSPLVQVPPQYPPKLLLNRIKGRVDVLIEIDEQGDVANYQIRQSTHTEFSNAVTRVILQWKFSPAIKDGKKVAVRKIQPFYFGKQ